LANFELALPADESRVANFDSRDVSNGIEFSRGAIEWDAEITGTNGLCWRRDGLACGGVEDKQE
jgi:hypothetical protein